MHYSERKHHRQVSATLALGVCSIAIMTAWLSVYAAVLQPAGRVTHYGVVITSLGGWKERTQLFLQINEKCLKLFREYGYPDESIYRLCEDGVTALPGVNGRATNANVRKVFRHLANIMGKGDHLFVILVGHGTMRNGDWVFDTISGITATELNGLLNALPTQDITIAVHPCYSGGAIPKLSQPGRVIFTSTTEAEENAHSWGIPELLFPKKGQRGPSIKQVYNATVDRAMHDYPGGLKEHPLLDDNGDGVGHFGKAPVVDGDGALAARRFMGDEGRKLNFPASAIQKLKDLNAGLVLSDLTRLYNVFAEEGVYLGGLGGYANDPGANSTNRSAHLSWARRQTGGAITRNLVNKYCLQFDRQARQGKTSAENFFAEASVRLASYGIDMGDPGANGREKTGHLEFAKRQTIPKLRENIERKVRALMGAASDSVAN